MFDWHKRDLEGLASQNRRRSLAPRSGIDFSSNDYLGLGASNQLMEAARAALERGVPVGSGGSRLLRGNCEEHEALEAEAAELFCSENALFFSTGFAANSALVSTLPQRGDLIIYDELVHASIHEGLRLTRADKTAAKHNDVNSVEDIIASWRKSGGKGTPWIAVEALYSMDGDFAPIDELMAVADRHDGVLIADEAHSTGVVGEAGRGVTGHLGKRENVITLRTFGKALGCEGAVICATHTVRDFLINRARGFIFSTAPSPLMAAIARGSLGLMRDQPEQRVQLQERIACAQRELATIGKSGSGSQIIPVILGEEAHTMAVAARLQAAGFDVRGIRPPTVPAGTSRLRVSITLNASEDDIKAMACALGEAIA